MDARTFRIINRLLWDYTISPEDVYEVIQGRKASCAHWDFDTIFLRMLERLGWYDLLHVPGADKIKSSLTPEIIEKIYLPERRKHYERLRKILHGESVSFTKWGPEFSKKIRNSLFSNRWYSTGPLTDDIL